MLGAALISFGSVFGIIFGVAAVVIIADKLEVK